MNEPDSDMLMSFLGKETKIDWDEYEKLLQSSAKPITIGLTLDDNRRYPTWIPHVINRLNNDPKLNIDESDESE